MSLVAKNIAWLRKMHALTQEQLSDAIGISRSRLANFETDKSRPNTEILEKIAHYFKVDAQRLQIEDLSVLEFEKEPRILTITIGEDEEGNIEFVPIKAAAGYTVGYGDPDFIRELPRFRLPFLSRGRYRAFEIQGDSMLPIPSGSVVVGQYVESLRDLKKGEAYIFITLNEGIVYKRLGDMGKGRIILQSDNPLYASYGLPLSEIQEVWKVKLYMTYHIPEIDKMIGRKEVMVGEVN